MLKLPVPSAAWSSQNITLGGLDYTFIYSYNTRDERWRVSIYLNEDPVILGIKIMENQRLLNDYILSNFDHGDVICFRVKDDGLPVGRNNLGIDKAYELVYFSNSELGEA